MDSRWISLAGLAVVALAIVGGSMYLLSTGANMTQQVSRVGSVTPPPGNGPLGQIAAAYQIALNSANPPAPNAAPASPSPAPSQTPSGPAAPGGAPPASPVTPAPEQPIDESKPGSTPGKTASRPARSPANQDKQTSERWPYQVPQGVR
ncbi:MAG: hypothetical protein SFZ24_02305 [Planctomycetota bacterium]|nr:hypothetical protein [Planctomycetota bacterium]